MLCEIPSVLQCIVRLIIENKRLIHMTEILLKWNIVVKRKGRRSIFSDGLCVFFCRILLFLRYLTYFLEILKQKTPHKH